MITVSEPQERLDMALNAVLSGSAIKDACSLFDVEEHDLTKSLRKEIVMVDPSESGEIKTEPLDEDTTTSEDLISHLEEGLSPSNRGTGRPRKSDGAQKKLRSKVHDMNLQDIFTVTCGHLEGLFYKEKFQCPGIHSACIEADGIWITPKQFSIMGGKASLKNWKSAIRSNGINLKIYMEAGTLTFWDHDNNCSGKCSHNMKTVSSKSTLPYRSMYQTRINHMEKKQIGEVEEFQKVVLEEPQSNNSSLISHGNDDDNLLIPLQQQDKILLSSRKIIKNSVSKEAANMLKIIQQHKEPSSNNDKATSIATINITEALTPQQPVFPSPTIKFEDEDSSQDSIDDSQTSGMPRLNTDEDDAAISPSNGKMVSLLRPVSLGTVQTVIEDTGSATSPSSLFPILRSNLNKMDTLTAVKPHVIEPMEKVPTHAEFLQNLQKQHNITPQGTASAELDEPPVLKSKPNTLVVASPVSTSASSSSLSYLVQNGKIQGEVKQVGHKYVLQKSFTAPPPDILSVASTIPDVDSLMKDSVTFWKGIVEMGLLDEVIMDVKTRLKLIKADILKYSSAEDNKHQYKQCVSSSFWEDQNKLLKKDCKQLSGIISALELQTALKYKLANHKLHVEKQNVQLQKEIDDLQRKVVANQKLQAEIKRKYACLDNFVTVSVTPEASCVAAATTTTSTSASAPTMKKIRLSAPFSLASGEEDDSKSASSDFVSSTGVVDSPKEKPQADESLNENQEKTPQSSATKRLRKIICDSPITIEDEEEQNAVDCEVKEIQDCDNDDDEKIKADEKLKEDDEALMEDDDELKHDENESIGDEKHDVEDDDVDVNMASSDDKEEESLDEEENESKQDEKQLSEDDFLPDEEDEEDDVKENEDYEVKSARNSPTTSAPNSNLGENESETSDIKLRLRRVKKK